MNDWEKIVGEFIANQKNVKSIYTGQDITPELLKKHSYCSLDGNEKPLVVVNSGRTLMNLCASGMVITNKSIFYRLTNPSFFAGLFGMFMKPIIGKMPVETVYHFQIGEHDTCAGTAYVGHFLMINDKKLGLLRMGNGVYLNDAMIEFINGLSSFLVKKGVLNKEPTEYLWQ